MKNKKIAIHYREGGYAKKWIEYCELNNLDFIIVDCYDNDIINRLLDVDILLWHYHRWEPKGGKVADHILTIAENMGITVFPNRMTRLSFDEKILQKYLLESVNAPIPDTKIFYNEKKAINWVKSQSDFKKVVKLSRGAGSKNVQLVDENLALIYISKMFKKGVFPFSVNWPKGNSLISKKYFYEWKRYFGFRKPETDRRNLAVGKESSYMYFQEFLPRNNHDIRVVVFRNKAIALKRYVKQGSFKASESGKISYDSNKIPLECIQKAFDVQKKLNFQCMAYDFVLDPSKGYLIVEICHGVSARSYDKCEGFWEVNLEWTKDDAICVEDFILEDILIEK